MVGGHATVGRLSSNDISTCIKQLEFLVRERESLETRDATVVERVTRPSSQTVRETFFGRFKRFEIDFERESLNGHERESRESHETEYG